MASNDNESKSVSAPEDLSNIRVVSLESRDDDGDTASFSAQSSGVRSSDLNTSPMDDSSMHSNIGSCVLDWRAEMSPGSVST